MKYKKVLIALFVSAFAVYGCLNKKGDQSTPQTQMIQSAKPAFTLPKLPDDLTAPLDRANYLVEHYWDNFDFSDTAYIHLPQITEQAMANFVEVLPFASKEIAYTSIQAMLSKAQVNNNVYTYFQAIYKKYLYDPNSQLRNEVFYIPVLEHFLANEATDAAEKERTKFVLEMINKNKIGDVATDFSYTLQTGKTATLHSLKGDLIIVMFYNPDCHACGELIVKLKSSQVIASMQQNKSLTILSFYPDEDLEIWKKHLSDIPASWVNGYDKQVTVNNKKKYDLKAIPTLYLLDRDKKVILKDVDFDVLEKWLYNYSSAKVLAIQ